MKKVLLTLFGIIVVVGVLAGAGFAGYRMGYMRGAIANSNSTIQVSPRNKDFDPRGMPMHNFGNGFERGFNKIPGHPGFGMMDRGMRGRGFGLIFPFFFLARVVVWGLIIWLVYKVIKGNGWQLSLTRQTAEAPQATTSAPKEQSSTQAD